MRGLALIALVLAPCLRAAAAEPAAELGARLSEQATAFVQEIVGRGHGRVLVTLEAERVQSHSERELSSPIEIAEPGSASLPGYAQAVKSKTSTMTTREVTESSSDLSIKKMHVTAVLDQRVSEADAATVKRLLPQFLQMDGDRGDDLVVVRAAMRPFWRDALESEGALRTGIIVGALLAAVLLLGLFGSVAALRSARSLSEALEKRAIPPPAQGPGGSPFGSLPPLDAEIVDGGLPGLTGGLEGGAPLQLGRRFDFLAGRKPDELAAMLAEETSEDMAHLFAHLASNNADLAGLIFSALPAQRQSEVSQLLAGLKMTEPERLGLLEGRLRMLSECAVRGPERLGAILSRLPIEQREGLLADIVTSKPDAAAEVERSVFAFEDISRLSPVDMRRLLSSLPYEEWGAALHESAPQLVEAVVGQLPPAAAEAVRESLGAATPRARVLEARSRVLSQVQAMMARGQIAAETAPS